MANWGDSTYLRQIMALERMLEEVGLQPLGVASALARRRGGGAPDVEMSR